MKRLQNKAVILGNNYYIGLSTIRCLGVKGIHTVAMDYSDEERYGAKSKHCHEKIIVPHYKKETEQFIQALIDYAKAQSCKPVLIPCHDSYVEVIDLYLDRLKEYYLIPQTEQGLYTEVMNKDTIFELAKKAGVRTPESVYVGEENFYEKVDEIIKYPCLVKPVDSPSFVEHFRKKLFIVNSKEELDEAIQLSEEAGLEVIVQRIIKGFDDHMYTFDAYVDQSAKVTHWTTCQKLRQYPINYGASVYTVQKHVPELYDIGSKFLETIGFKGFAEIEFKKDAETGNFYLIEVNARITNLNSLLYDVGLNFPYITYMDLIGEPLAPNAIVEDTNRAFWYFHEDTLAIIDYVKARQLSLRPIIKTFFRRKSYAIWDWKDLRPGLYYNTSMLVKLFKKLFRIKN